MPAKKKPITVKKRTSAKKRAPRRKRVKRSPHLKLTYKLLIGAGGAILIILTALFLAPRVVVLDGFQEQTQLERYAEKFDELKIKMDGANLVRPNYTTHYKGFQRGFWAERVNRLFTILKFRKKPLWTAETFKRLLEKLSERSEEKKLTGNFIHKIVTNPESKIVVWGDIQGAFHSLVRDLGQLKKLGIISNDLQVINPNYYLVFVGDVVSRSPFIMETVSAVMQLVWKNPNNVFYLRGNHEANDYWQGYGLKRELKLRATHLKTKEDKVPLKTLVRKYFNTLPIAIYFGMEPEEDRKFLRISHEGGNEFKVVKINESKYDEYLQRPLKDKVGTLHIDGLEADNSRLIALQAIIRAEVKRKSYQSNDGMRLIAPEDGVTSWTFFSCPTEVYRKALKFYNDAFGIIAAGKEPDDWTITLHKQDMRSRDGFQVRSHYLLSGKPVGAKDDQDKAPTAIEEKEISKETPVTSTKKPQKPSSDTEITFVSEIQDIPELNKKPVPTVHATPIKISLETPKPASSTPESVDTTQTFTIALKCKLSKGNVKQTSQETLGLECRVVTPSADNKTLPEIDLGKLMPIKVKPKHPSAIIPPGIARRHARHYNATGRLTEQGPIDWRGMPLPPKVSRKSYAPRRYETRRTYHTRPPRSYRMQEGLYRRTISTMPYAKKTGTSLEEKSVSSSPSTLTKITKKKVERSRQKSFKQKLVATETEPEPEPLEEELPNVLESEKIPLALGTIL